MIITGVDHKHEDLLEWWIKNIKKHHNSYDTKIGVFDLGMSPAFRSRMESNHADLYWPRPINGTQSRKIAWYYKVKCVIECPEDQVLWLDVDCQVLSNLSEVWNLTPPGTIGLTRDIIRSNWWATGVICVNDRPKLLHDWHERLYTLQDRGDQEALNALIGTNNHEEIQELPQDYQWLRLSIANGNDSSTKKVIHWTGPEGKRIIRENLIQ